MGDRAGLAQVYAELNESLGPRRPVGSDLKTSLETARWRAEHAAGLVDAQVDRIDERPGASQWAVDP